MKSSTYTNNLVTSNVRASSLKHTFDIKKSLTNISLVSLLVVSSPVYAAPVTFAYSGNITSVVDSDHPAGNLPPYLISDYVSPGDRFYFEYTFDSNAIGSCACLDRYNFVDSISDILFQTANLSISLSNGTLEVDNNRNSKDQYILRSDFRQSGTGVVNGAALSGDFRAAFDFVDTTASAFDSRNLPLTQPDPSDFGSNSFQVWASFPGGINWIISSDNLQISSVQNVPVPAAGWLFLSGLAGIFSITTNNHLRLKKHMSRAA